MLTKTALKEYLDFALCVATSAGRLVLQQLKGGGVARNDDGSEVTDADREAESLMRTMIARRYPSHGILGEEFGEAEAADSGLLWVLDPIDGTAWYAMGTPLFGNLVALLEDGEPVLGVIHLPGFGETICAAKGHGCWSITGSSSPVRLRVMPCASLRHATVLASGIQRSEMEGAKGGYRLGGIVRAAQKFKFYGDCVQHAVVCRGDASAAIDTVMRPWDSAAIVPCVEEAGGVVTTLEGERHNVVFGGSLLTSSGPALHDELIRSLNAGRSVESEFGCPVFPLQRPA